MTEITARLSTALADRYKLERHLGEGGMANVYLAHDLKHERKVAVKVLRPELSAILGGERFRLGELYEEAGDRDKAVEFYSQFVELWTDADAELQPLVEDVRGRIARLMEEGA